MTDHRYDEGPTGIPARHMPDAGRVVGIGVDRPKLPALFITSRDHRRLRPLLAAARDSVDPAVLRFLARELDRASVCEPDMVPPDVVTMNSRVFFRPHLNRPLESRTLVYDDEQSVVGGGIPILTPLGVALLGVREHDKMPYVSIEGSCSVLVVERVAYQPEGEGRLLRAPYRYWPKTHRASDRADRNRPLPDEGDENRTVVPLRPRPTPRPIVPDEDDDPDPNRAA